MVVVILVAVAVVGGAAAYFLLSRGGGSRGAVDPGVPQARRRLARNPRDAEALLTVAEAEFSAGAYADAARHYQGLVDLCATHPELDEFAMTLRQGVSLLQSGQVEEALRSLMIARTIKADDFQVNFHLGSLEVDRKSPDKAAGFLQAALGAQPDHVPTARLLGLALHKLKRYGEAIAPLEQAVAGEPGDKEAAFALAHCRIENGDGERALALLTPMRADPQWGPRACLYAGTVRLNAKDYEHAVEDFELGLRHEGLAQAMAHELRYRLAMVWLHQEQIARAVELLRGIADENPGFKDVETLLTRYRDVASDRMLQTYTLAPAPEFVALCRRLVAATFPSGKVKVVDITIRKNDWVDIVAQVTTNRWEDMVLFRFLRGMGIVGELVVREMYARMREVRTTRGVCFSAGVFSDASRAFVEARLMDLVDKNGLATLFARLRAAARRTKARP
jgi:tetratricopeptide (TPR) repeat protein